MTQSPVNWLTSHHLLKKKISTFTFMIEVGVLIYKKVHFPIDLNEMTKSPFIRKSKDYIGLNGSGTP